MARNQYLITYKDGSRRHVDREERDSLLLSRCLEQVGPRDYHCNIPLRTYHSFADLAEIKFQPVNPLRRFLAGSFIFEFQGRQHKERLETPEAFAFRLQLT